MATRTRTTPTGLTRHPKLAAIAVCAGLYTAGQLAFGAGPFLY